ncbi:helix-turn-helix domain-containing protein [Mucilaginibacter litoreus]|uniref:Helix-turn-helix domain-containing protein n=1 Tax=Mucilaginibacter litoreus TaxID=1048221 RepID=A0ABW3AXN8_9SPHI
MEKITSSSLEEFYKRNGAALPERIIEEIGHFNIFESEKLFNKEDGTRQMPYSRRSYYKISLLRGKSDAEYADKTIHINGNALLFATPKIPYKWNPADADQTGMFCVFTPDFLLPSKSGVILEDMPIFQPGGIPVFEVSATQATEIEYIFRKMQKEIAADYKFKYDLLRNLLLELIHFGQKLTPMATLSNTQNASERIASLFVELLERQFPLQSANQRLNLRTPHQYAERLAVHVNHLNKSLKEATGQTTTNLIAMRIIQEAKILLRQTDWNISEIAWTLGFDDIAQFSNFFKKDTSYSPSAFRLN